ncbi:MAG: NADH-quinone oxidoreductase subunit N [Verrucomicrobiales bacterium]|nr:NADH-quinone oxidoreductase subunit N [Verrucomicrobiales bacterium]
MDYLELLRLLGGEVLVVAAALAVLFVDLGIMREQPARNRWMISGGVAVLGCIAGLFWCVQGGVEGRSPGGLLAVDGLTQLVKAALLLMVLLTVLFSFHAGFTPHVGEYFSLLLLAAVGMMLMVSSENVLMVFVSLELTSLSLYILTAFNEENPHGLEAALKYFLFGGVAAAFLLFGLSLLYGLTGSLDLREIAAGLRGRGATPAMSAAVALVVVGFGFKVAAVPFHLWAPDAYEGAPTPVAALVASGSKVASFFLLGRVLMTGLPPEAGDPGWLKGGGGWGLALAVLAVVSLVLGNVAAIAQKRVKRLLAYSAVAHAGYVLVAMAALGFPSARAEAFASVLFYVVTYGLTTVGAFGLVGAMERGGAGDRLTDLAGACQRSPGLSMGLLICFLSLAGIPPLAGFVGKFAVFASALAGDGASLSMLWLVVVAVAMSAVGLYYYLKVLKQVFVLPATGVMPAGRAGVAEAVGLWLACGGVVVLGLWPALLLDPLRQAIAAAGL